MHKPRSRKPIYAIALLLLATLATLGFRISWSQASRPEKPDPSESLAPDAQAQHLLDEILADLGPDKTPWLETKVRQKVHLTGVAYTAEGRYQTAPGHRCRLEMHTQAGQATGQMLVVSDGQQLWRAKRVGDADGPWASVELAGLECFKTAQEGHWPQARGEKSMSFTGVEPLLQNLRTRLDWVGATQEAGGQVVLTGVWPAARRAQIAPAGQAWPTGQPRQCRLTVDVQSHWPQRVEWWGPLTGDGRTELLAEMEFADPVRNRPLTNEECGSLFTFDPGTTPVKNQAGEMPSKE